MITEPRRLDTLPQDFFTRDKNFYRTFIRLCLTLMLEQAVILSVNLADNLMLGTYSEAALSGVAAVNQVQFVFQQLVHAVGTGMIVIASQYWGKKRLTEIRQVSAIACRIEIILAAILFIIVSLFPEGVMRVFTDSDEFVRQGVDYLKIIRFSYLFFALTACLLNTMRVVEVVNIALVVSAIALVVNVCINYLLIAGHMGMPEMGVRGAAIGTLVARVVEFFIVLVYVLKDKKLEMRIRDFLRWNGRLAADYLRVTLPVLGSSALWGFGNAAQTVILGHMNDSAIAAQSISSTVFLLLKVTSVGASSAASVLIGKTVGQGDMKRLKSYVHTLQAIFIGIGCMLCLIMLGIRIPLLNIYRKGISPETYQLASTYMLIQAGVLFFMAYQMPTNTGIIRGGGDTKFVLILDIIGIGVFIPMAALGGLVWKWSAIAVIICMNLDQFLKIFPAAIWGNRYRWVRKLTRETEN